MAALISVWGSDKVGVRVGSVGTNVSESGAHTVAKLPAPHLAASSTAPHETVWRPRAHTRFIYGRVLPCAPFPMRAGAHALVIMANFTPLQRLVSDGTALRWNAQHPN